MDIARSAFPLVQKVVQVSAPSGLEKSLRRLMWTIRGYPASIGGSLNSKLCRSIEAEAIGNDLVHLDSFPFAPCIRSLQRCAPVVLTCQDAFSFGLSRALNSVKWSRHTLGLAVRARAFRRFESRYYPGANVAGTLSQLDTSYLKALGVDRARTLRVDFARGRTRRRNMTQISSPGVLLVAPASSVPWVMQDAVELLRLLVSRVRKDQGASAQIVVWGRMAAEVLERAGGGAGVQAVEFAENYWDFLDRNWIYVYPRRVGSGLHTKVVEAMSIGLPVVGYREILGAIGAEHGREYFSCSEPEEVAEAVSKLLASQDLRSCVGDAASRYIDTRFRKELGEYSIDALYNQALAVRS